MSNRSLLGLHLVSFSQTIKYPVSQTLKLCSQLPPLPKVLVLDTTLCQTNQTGSHILYHTSLPNHAFTLTT